MNEPMAIVEQEELEQQHIPGPVFKFVEFKLYHYMENQRAVMRYNSTRQDILERGRQVEPGATYGGQTGNPVEKKTIQLVLLEDKVFRELSWIEAIEDVLSALPEEDRKLVQLKYFDGFLTNAGVARELRMSIATYYRRRDYLVRRFAVRFGLL